MGSSGGTTLKLNPQSGFWISIETERVSLILILYLKANEMASL